MSDLYEAAAGSFGSFTTPFPGGSTEKGYYQQPLNVPVYGGRSILATIPEYQRNPLQLEKDLLFKFHEGRANMMKILMEDVEAGGGHTVNDVRFRMPVEVEPLQRIYLDTQAATGNAVNSAGTSTFIVKSNTTKIATAMSGGNPKQIGDIGRLEVDQFIMLMFSWTSPQRDALVEDADGTNSAEYVVYEPQPVRSAPVPELCKIIAIDYDLSTIDVTRNWAGEQRTSFTYSTTTIPSVEILVAGSATAGVWGAGASKKIPAKHAFLIPMAKSMQEDEIDAKIRNYSNTFQVGVLQRHLMAWGSQYFAEIVNSNMGLESPFAKSKRQAIKDYYDYWEWSSLFSQKSEAYDAETGFWAGTTDGLLANIPDSHYHAIKGVNYNASFAAGASTGFGSFQPIVFNKIMDGKSLIGSQDKVLVCGADFHTAFSSMINHMTQAVPDIKSSWNVMGKSFSTSDGLNITVVPSDKMTLNGMRASAILYDKKYFKAVNLRNYPGADIYNVQNENPLKRNGFIHGVKGFIDRNPDAHWVFTMVNPLREDGSSNATAYASVATLGDVTV